MNEVVPPLPSPRRFPVVGAILVGWVALYLLMMWHGGWRWGTGLGFGSPRPGTLREFGALVPAQLRWQSFWLSPLLHHSLLGLLFLGFFWRSTGRAILTLMGPSWTFVTFVVGGLAGSAAHVHAYSDSSLIAGAGPFDPILCAIGLQLGWGLFHRNALGLARSALWTLLMICAFTGIMLFAQGVRDFTTPRIREAIGFEAMLGALCAGVLLALLIGIAERIAEAPSVWLGRALAALLAFGTLGALVTQAAPILRSAERREALSFLNQLRRVERATDKLLDQRGATQAGRDALAVEHGRLLSHTFLEGYPGKESLLEYAKVMGLYKQPVGAPFITEPQLRKRFKAWYDRYEGPLREEFALSRRESPWSEP